MMTPEIWQQQRLDNWTKFQRDQLNEWGPIAAKWRLYLDDSAYRCCLCNQCIWFSHDMYGEPYQYTTEEILALITAHVRQVHAENTTAREEMPVQDMQESRDE